MRSFHKHSSELIMLNVEIINFDYEHSRAVTTTFNCMLIHEDLTDIRIHILDK